MAALSHAELNEWIVVMNNNLRRDFGYRVDKLDFSADIFTVYTYTASDHFSILTLTRPPALQGQTRLDVAGGGAHNTYASPALFQHLLSRATDFFWGGPFVSFDSPSTVTFGARTAVPSDLLGRDNNWIGFVSGMIRVMGASARQLATEILPHDGGELFTGADGDGTALMVSARVGG